MKILVLGSEGFIGGRICTALEKEGHEIIHFDRTIGSDFSRLPNVDLVYHFAAQTNINYSLSHPTNDALDNIILTTQLIERYPDTKIIYPASAASLDIKSPYGLSKKVAADYIKLLHKEYVIVTLPNIWGEGSKGVISKFKEAKVLTIFGNGEQSRTIVHVDDVVQAFLLSRYWPTGEYSLGGENLTINEIAKRIGKPVEYKPQHGGHIFASVVPNTTPDWQPTIKLC